MNRARHKLEEAAHSYYAQYIVIFFLCYLRISTTIIDFYEHQHCKVQTKADRFYHGCCRLAGRFFLNREWEKSVTIMVLQYARIIL